MKRGAKQNPYSQIKIMIAVLSKGGSFTELEFGKILYGNEIRGVRALIATARKEGHQIADKTVINPRTKRKNKSYYIELNELRYLKWAKANGEFNFQVGAPK
jgi:hypothetical protein